MLTIEQIKKVAQEGPFQPSWQSLNKFKVPEWFTKAKFGIFIHWGLYSVPAFRNEWYSRNMYIQGTPEYKHHRDTYGKQTDFGYKDFIPLFTAKKFDAEKWLDIFKKSGAKYIFPVAEHHDGFQMYKSEISKFNSYDMGPQKDFLAHLRHAAEEKNIHFCTSSHRAEHWFFFGHGKEFPSDVLEQAASKGDFYWPAMPEPDNQDLYSKPEPSTEFLEDWLLRTCEIIDNYQPELLYFDWWIQHRSFKKYLKILSAFYYNRGVEWNKEVGICYKHDAMMFGSGIVEIERGKFSDAKPYYWQSDTAIGRNSWCYTETLDYKKPIEIIQDMIEVVSKNGNLLLNVGPMANGEISEKDQQILFKIGKWLSTNGEAIYESKVWRKSGEGPTQISEGQFQENTITTYTSDDIRFTVKGSAIYAFFMTAPTKKGCITSLKISKDQNVPEFHGIIKEVTLLGYDKPIQWEQTTKGLLVSCPEEFSDLPIVYKIIIE